MNLIICVLLMFNCRNICSKMMLEDGWDVVLSKKGKSLCGLKIESILKLMSLLYDKKEGMFFLFFILEYNFFLYCSMKINDK